MIVLFPFLKTIQGYYYATLLYKFHLDGIKYFFLLWVFLFIPTSVVNTRSTQSFFTKQIAIRPFA